MVKELDYTKLKQFIKIEDLNFRTTKELESYTDIIGQERAKKALEFGLSVKMKGYNIYVSGLPGTGRTTFSEQFARKIAKTEKTPPDLCYVYNFKNPKCPKMLMLPPGTGKIIKEELDDLINRLTNELPKVFSDKDFENSKAEIVKSYHDKREEIIKVVTEEAREQMFGVKTTNTGIYFMPIVDGEIISEEQFDALPQDKKDEISKNSEAIQKRAQEAMREIKDYEKLIRKDVDDFEYSIALLAVGHQLSPLLEKYSNNDDVVKYLLEIKEDILENVADFLEQETSEEAVFPWYPKKAPEDNFSKYKVNLLTDNSNQTGAPVIVDFNPTYSNLIGEIEYDNEYGNLITDFMKIKPGLIHKANGGYLILQAYDLFSNYHAWEALRRVLLTKEVVTECLREYSTGALVSGIKPEPVPIDLKVIIVGTDFFYNLLYEYDDEFSKLFKIYADFDYEMNHTKDIIEQISRYVKAFVEKEKTLEFSALAVAAVIEHSVRLAERQGKLTTRFNRICEVLAEAYTWAKLEDASIITEKHVKKAISEHEFRFNMYEEKLSELIEQEIIMIDTHGFKVGQINGLAVFDAGDYAFAKPSKITATTYVGKAGIINIEKEAEMSGSIHDKGVQVLSGFLGQTYAQEFPLSLSCRLCFEQTYSGVDGDSASSTELYAVLSSLADVPINQEIAVTGSINQRGEIQAIGGVTYKIEGFFDLCNKRGLTGKQGVVIPYQNVKDLVLKDEVIEAVKNGIFHIYPISHVDEGIEILTGIKAGIKNEKGKYSPGTIHGRIFKKLKDFYKKSINE